MGLGEINKNGQNVIDAAIKINSEYLKIAEDIRFYQENKGEAYNYLTGGVEFLQGLVDKTIDLSNELGVEPESINGYRSALDAIIEAKRISNDINSNTLLFNF
jgi:hypothetical protein